MKWKSVAASRNKLTKSLSLGVDVHALVHTYSEQRQKQISLSILYIEFVPKVVRKLKQNRSFRLLVVTSEHHTFLQSHVIWHQTNSA